MPWDAAHDDYSAGDEHGGGILMLLNDRQVHIEEETEYHHSAYQVVHRSGLQSASQLLIQYDPTYQQVQLHTLKLHRSGHVMDLLPTQAFRVLERETNLEWNLYDGRLDIQTLLEDTRVGDIIENAYSIVGFNSVFKARYSATYILSTTYPTRSMSLRVMHRAERDVRWDRYYPEGAVAFEHRTDGAFVDLRWEGSNLAPVVEDDRIPSWHIPYDWIHLSDFRSWAEVAAWASEVYEVPAVVPAEIREVADNIRTNQLPEDQIIAALAYVQQELRYVSLSAGLHSHAPYPISLVLRRRFGDCKDQSILLTALLRQLGFEAYPALVSTSFREKVADIGPSLATFDHVIVALRFRDATFWLDPTQTHQAGTLYHRPIPNYGKALVAHKQTRALEDIAMTDQDAHGMTVTEVWHLQAWDKPARMTVETLYGGHEADWMRATIQSSGRAKLEQHYLQYYDTLYSGVTLASPMTIKDFPDVNRLIVHESYEVSNFLQGDGSDPYTRYLHIDPNTVRELLVAPATANRTAPLGLFYPKNIVHEHRIHLPEPGQFEMTTQTVSNAYFRYGSTARTETNVLILRYGYQSHADHVPVGDIAAFRLDIDRALLDAQYSIQVPAALWNESSAELKDVNMLILFYLIICIAASLAVVYRMLRWHPPPNLRMVAADPALTGIGGWLWLLLLRLLVIIGVSTAGLYTLAESGVWRSSVWHSMTTPGSASYQPFHQPLILLTTGVVISCLILAIMTLWLFVKKRRSFSANMKTIMLLNVMAAAVDIVHLSLMNEPMAKELAQLVTAIITMFLWFWYLNVSRRVRATFTT